MSLEAILAIESGELDEEQLATAYQGLIDSGVIKHLQGTYQRTAQDLIQAGLCTPQAPAPLNPALHVEIPHGGGLAARYVGPYTGVEWLIEVTFITRKGPRKFMILTYQAYNACGLIGCENNGVAIMDCDSLRVLADALFPEGSGWSGASIEQVMGWNSLRQMSWPDFQAFVNGSKRARYKI